MSKAIKKQESDEIYEDDFEKFINEDIEEDIDDDEQFLKTLGFITDDVNGEKSDVSHRLWIMPI